MKAGAGIGEVLGDDVVRPLNNARSRSPLFAVILHRSARPCAVSLHIACFMRGGSSSRLPCVMVLMGCPCRACALGFACSCCLFRKETCVVTHRVCASQCSVLASLLISYCDLVSRCYPVVSLRLVSPTLLACWHAAGPIQLCVLPAVGGGRAARAGGGGRPNQLPAFPHAALHHVLHGAPGRQRPGLRVVSARALGRWAKVLVWRSVVRPGERTAFCGHAAYIDRSAQAAPARFLRCIQCEGMSNSVCVVMCTVVVRRREWSRLI